MTRCRRAGPGWADPSKAKRGMKGAMQHKSPEQDVEAREAARRMAYEEISVPGTQAAPMAWHTKMRADQHWTVVRGATATQEAPHVWARQLNVEHVKRRRRGHAGVNVQLEKKG